MASKTGIQAAVDQYDGSPSRLAAALGNGVLRQHVEHWLRAGRVSAGRCPEVSALTGIPCNELNDRVNWELASTMVLRRKSHDAPAANDPTKPAARRWKARGAV